MESIYDWLTVGLFAGLIVLFLQRSSDDSNSDSIWSYLPAGVGCAVADVAGNNGYHLLAAILMVTTLGYIFVVLKPFGKPWSGGPF